ncbi:hypothetical protein HPB50_019982 [Hyalomma asiaticum]|uniref:Uncharacterized protein n=1 Tax=Hyalomma asiaticum TaxID=266040 RepID=A0ACB7SXL7_HYAAI|nr:hypothetical protein HPB50_019982 [Hyalomma asiaticum]
MHQGCQKQKYLNLEGVTYVDAAEYRDHAGISVVGVDAEGQRLVSCTVITYALEIAEEAAIAMAITSTSDQRWRGVAQVIWTPAHSLPAIEAAHTVARRLQIRQSNWGPEEIAQSQYVIKNPQITIGQDGPCNPRLTLD